MREAITCGVLLYASSRSAPAWYVDDAAAAGRAEWNVEPAAFRICPDGEARVVAGLETRAAFDAQIRAAVIGPVRVALGDEVRAACGSQIAAVLSG